MASDNAVNHIPKQVTRALVFLILWGIGAFSALAGTSADGITIIVNGQQKVFADSPRVVAGRVLVPARGLLETLGFVVEWSPGGQIRIAKEQKEIIVRVGDKQAVVDGVVRIMDAAPLRLGSRVFFPLRFFAEAFRGIVTWDPATRVVSVVFPTGTLQPSSTSQAVPPASQAPLPPLPKGALEEGVVVSIELSASPQRIVIRGPLIVRTFIILSGTTSFHRLDLNSGRTIAIEPRQVFPGDFVRLSVEVGQGPLQGVIRRLLVVVREEFGLVRSIDSRMIQLTSGKSFSLGESVRVVRGSTFLTLFDVGPGTSVILRINPQTGEVVEVEIS